MRRHSKALDIAGFLAIAGLALLLWPQRWGGTMTYDITHGTSMQPSFVAGDLAILRTSDSYRVGDVAAYRSPSLHTTVMHRIKTASNGRYTFQGDNNDFVDADVVTDQQMLGKLVLRVPGVGRVLAWLVKPVNLALAAGALFLLLSDRKARGEQSVPAQDPAADGAPPLVVRITALRLPHELPTADVATYDDLVKLAKLHSLAVLRGEEADFVLQSGMLFRYTRSSELGLTPPSGRHPSEHGRDWDYAPRHANVVDLQERRAAVS